MSVMDYCEYNATKFLRAKTPSAQVRAAWVDAAITVPVVQPTDYGTLVEEHDPNGTTGVRVRAIHEAMRVAKEGR